MIKCKRRFMHGKRRRRSPIKSDYFTPDIDAMTSVSDSASRGVQSRSIEPDIKIEKKPDRFAVPNIDTKPGKLYSKDAQNLKQMKVLQQMNPVSRLITGILPKGSI